MQAQLGHLWLELTLARLPPPPKRHRAQDPQDPAALLTKPGKASARVRQSNRGWVWFWGHGDLFFVGVFFLPFSLLGVGRRRVKHSLVPFHLHDALGIQVQLCKATRRGAVPMARAPPRPLARRGSSPPAGSRSGRGGGASQPSLSEGLRVRVRGFTLPPARAPQARPRCRPLPTPPLPPRPETPPPPSPAPPAGYLSCSSAGP